MTADRLRIAVIASNRFPISQPFAGGLEAHVWHLARALTDRGHDVSLFAAPGSDEGERLSRLDVRELHLTEAARSDAAMPEVRFMADHHAYLNLMVQLARADQFDLIHNHSLHHLPIAMAPTLRTPMLCTLHTPPTPWLESAILTTGGEGVRFVAVSNHTADAWRPLIDSVDVVRNGIDLDHWPLGPGGDEVVWFGRLTAEKGPHLAIEAARRAGVRLVLAGPVSDENYYRRQIEPELGGSIRYAGHLTQPELADLVGRCAVALMTPRWDEPYGLVVAESLACGTPVVAFARGGIPELLNSTGCGRLVGPDDVAGMAAAIPVAAGLRRAAVRDHARRHCSADGMVSAYVDVYRQMIRDSPHESLDDSPRRTA